MATPSRAPRHVSVEFRLSREEKEDLVALASAEGQEISAYLRSLIRKAALRRRATLQRLVGALSSDRPSRRPDPRT